METDSVIPTKASLVMFGTVQQRSRLLRAALLLICVIAALAVIGMVFEWLNVAREVSVHRLVRLVVLGAANLLLTAGLAVIAALFLWTRIARSLPDLKGWHIQRPTNEFCAADVDDGYTFDEYQQQENEVFAELDSFVTDDWSEQAAATYCRFNPTSECNSANLFERDWNRTQVVKADKPIGGALLLHGLSDSPYSMRAIGERLLSEGYTVAWLRVPGHGTNPRALADVTWEDWTAAVAVAMNGLREAVPEELPLIAAGYSNGGALSLHYALASIEDDALPSLSAVVLFSPMIGVNPLARITRLYHAVGLISRDEKSKWSSISAEIDPFKYSSWPMNGNVQAWNLTSVVERKLVALQKSGRMDSLPPVLAMQSVVDATVVVPKLITNLFDRLTSESSELFLFDVNRMDSLSNLLNLSFERTIMPKLDRTDRPFRLTVLANAEGSSSQLVLKVRDQGRWTEEPVQLSWPDGVVSLSHVAIPFPSSDPVYGQESNAVGLGLGTLSMRAEPNALLIPSSLFARCRSNPFYEFMEDRVVDWLAKNVPARTTTP